MLSNTQAETSHDEAVEVVAAVMLQQASSKTCQSFGDLMKGCRCHLNEGLDKIFYYQAAFGKLVASGQIFEADIDADSSTPLYSRAFH